MHKHKILAITGIAVGAVLIGGLVWYNATNKKQNNAAAGSATTGGNVQQPVVNSVSSGSGNVYHAPIIN